MADDVAPAEQESARVGAFVKARISEAGWGPVDALTWAIDRDLVVSEFEAVVALTRLCVDDPERKEPVHILGHRATLIKNCVTEDFIPRMAKKLGLSDERARWIIDHQDAALRTYEGQHGSGER